MQDPFQHLMQEATRLMFDGVASPLAPTLGASTAATSASLRRAYGNVTYVNTAKKKTKNRG